MEVKRPARTEVLKTALDSPQFNKDWWKEAFNSCFKKLASPRAPKPANSW